MSKFLEILEQHDPVNGDKLSAAASAKWFLYDKKIPFSSWIHEITLHTPEGDVLLNVVGYKKKKEPAEEDNNEVNYDFEVDKEVENLSKKPLLKLGGVGTFPILKARSAMKEKEKLATGAIGIVRDRNKQLKQAIANAKKNPSNVNVNVR